jgi:uncharacterized membrane protein
VPEPAQNYQGSAARGRLHGQAINVWLIALSVLILWNSLFIFAPLFSAEPIYSFFSYICHQIPERSITVFGGQMAVCSRCFGIYAGLAAGAIIYPIRKGFDVTEPISKLWLFLALVPVGADWSLTAFRIWENTHLSRFVTGAILGVVCAFFILLALIEIVRNFSRRSVKDFSNISR